MAARRPQRRMINGNIVGIDKTWPDGDQTHITVDTDTNVATATETPNGQMALTPVSIDAGETTTTGKTTVTNGEPNSITLTHDTTPTDTDGNPTSGPSSTSETILPDGTVAYFKSDTGDAVSVASSNYYVTTTTNDPDGGTTATTTNGNDKVTNIEKTWPDGDQTQVAINTETNVITTTETPNGQEPLTPVIINQGDTATTGKTTVTNNEPTGGVTLSHDTTGTDAEGHPTAPTTIGETVTPTGSVSYENSAVGDAVSVNSSDYYVTTTTTDPDGGTTATTVNGNGDVTQINKTWADGDQTQVSITPDDTEPSTSVVTTAETPNGGEPVGPVSVPTDTAVTTGKTTVTNSEPDGVTLSHTTTGTDADGNPVTVTTSETVTAQGELSYAKSASAAPVNVDPDGYFASTTTDDPNGGTTVTTTNGNGQVTKIDKTWPDGDETQVAVNTSTNVVTTTETPSVQEPLAPVTISPNDTATTGKTTVTNNEPDGVTLSHDTTGTDADGNPTSATTGETVTSTGTTSYTKSASAAPVSVDPSDYSVTTTTDDPNGGTTTTTDGNDKVTKINKTWPDGDKTQVDIDTSNNEITTTETPSGQDPLAPVTTKPGETSTTGKTTVTNDEPDGVTLSHDTTGTDSAGNPTAPSTTGETVTPTGTVSYFKTAVGDAISVDPSDYFVTGEPVTDPDGGTTTTTKDGNGNVVKIDKTWPDSDQTQVDVDTDTNEITTTETPNGQDPMTPVTTQPGKTTTTGKTTVTNNEPNGGVTLSHDITGSDTEGNPTAPSTTGETVTPTGAISYLKTAVGDAVSVDPSNYFVTGQPVTDPDGGTTTTTKDGNGNVVKIDKTWSDGDQTQVDVDTSTNEITTTETPSGQDPLTPVTTQSNETTTTGKTTVTNNEPTGVTLSHDTTGTNSDGNPTAPSTTGETVTPTGTITYTKTANADPVSVDPSDYYVTTTTDDPNGGTTTLTTNGNGEVTTIDKTWPNGDQTHVAIDQNGTATATETPSGQPSLTPITVQPGETSQTGETTVQNNEPNGITLTHGGTGTDTTGNTTGQTGETVTSDGTISYTKSDVPTPPSVSASDYYDNTTGSGNSGTNAGTENNTTGTTGETGTTGTVTGTGSSSETGTDVSTTNSGAHSNTVKTTTIGQGANTIATNSNSTEAGVNNISTAQAASQSVATTNKSLDQPTHTADQTGKQNLPQTSESTNQAGVLGLLGAILGIFGLAGTRRKKHEDN
ncbi:LPXTG cell wall anchor domain-containing protein [Secundilactobacillus paracollinoides]|nr:LPXTG cell wall anchor domain-containing protein [Secundilactobacillus paracollinoides]